MSLRRRGGGGGEAPDTTRARAQLRQAPMNGASPAAAPPDPASQEKTRFLVELEFIQCLANAKYLHCAPPTSIHRLTHCQGSRKAATFKTLPSLIILSICNIGNDQNTPSTSPIPIASPSLICCKSNRFDNNSSTHKLWSIFTRSSSTTGSTTCVKKKMHLSTCHMTFCSATIA